MRTDAYIVIIFNVDKVDLRKFGSEAAEISISLSGDNAIQSDWKISHYTHIVDDLSYMYLWYFIC